MNRQIKFKGKSLVNGKWVTGDSIKHTDNASEKGIEELTYIGNNVPNASKVGAMKWIPVNPDTIGQYSGLKDCNGKEIYEGDILRCEAYDWNNEKLGYGYYEVYWEDEENGFLVSPINEIAEKIRKWHWLNDMEIVGNRFDNPELL